MRLALAPHLAGRRQLLVATHGRLGGAACVRLGGPRMLVRTLASGREVISPLLARPAGWLAWPRGRRIV